jgi:hypothetical protein
MQRSAPIDRNHSALARVSVVGPGIEDMELVQHLLPVVTQCFSPGSPYFGDFVVLLRR